MSIRKIKIALILALPFISNACLAEKPTTCPSIASISALNFDSANLSDGFPGKWYVMQINKAYDTNVKWDFAIIIDAKNHDDALKIAINEVTSIKNPIGPVDMGAGYYMCEYPRPSKPEAIAFYPSGVNTFKIK